MRRPARNFRTVNWPMFLRRSPRSTSGTGWAPRIAGHRPGAKKLLPRRRHKIANRKSPLAALQRIITEYVLRQRMRHGRQRIGFGSDLAPASADQALIGRD